MRETDDIERLFQDSFESFETTPPASVKVAIDKQIGGKALHFGWFSAVITVLAVTAICCFALTNFNNKPQISHNNDQSSSTDISNSSTDNSSSSNSSNNSSISHKPQSLHTSSSIVESKQNTNTSKTAGSANSSNKEIRLKTTIKKKATSSAAAGSRTFSKSAVNSNKKTIISKTKKKSVKKNHSKKNSSKENTKTETQEEYAMIRSDNKNQREKIVKEREEFEKRKAMKEAAEQSNGDKSNSTNPINTTADIGSTTQPVDSIDKSVKESPEALATVDSTKNNESTDDNKNDNKPSKWLASLYFGPQFDIRKSTYAYKNLDIKPSFRISAEINRNIIAGYGISTGIGYNKTSETYTVSNFTYDSVLHIDSIPQYDQQNPDSIIGYNVVNTYITDTIQTDYPSTYITSTLFLPIYATKQFSFGEKWGMLINAGAVFSFYSIKGGGVPLGSEPEPTRNKSGILLSGRLQATYKWNDWMFSAGVNGGWYAKPPVGYAEFKGNRYFVSPQFGIHYTF